MSGSLLGPAHDQRVVSSRGRSCTLKLLDATRLEMRTLRDTVSSRCHRLPNNPLCHKSAMILQVKRLKLEFEGVGLEATCCFYRLESKTRLHLLGNQLHRRFLQGNTKLKAKGYSGMSHKPEDACLQLHKTKLGHPDNFISRL